MFGYESQIKTKKCLQDTLSIMYIFVTYVSLRIICSHKECQYLCGETCWKFILKHLNESYKFDNNCT